ncbi:DUF4382 domain-containing protein [Geothrix sp.]|jgi:hypothetical protein|uniref:DUF4382 domain-containing protein n=1 Tax=Geothrix sp. TaxID=1962974 RepID=UPI0025C424EA|nr:DUF4382 domain-containing protein [Geothrix sp.]
MRLRPILVALVSLGLTLACGGGGGGGNRTSPSGTLTLRLGADSFPGFSQAIVSLEKVEASVDGGTWVPLGDIKATFDLLALQGGGSTLVLPAKSVTAATYAQFRLTWATVNYQSVSHVAAYLISSGGIEQSLAMPAATVVSGPVTVPANGNVTAQIMLNGQQMVQSHAGSASTYTFQATGRAFDMGATARITGHLSAGSTPLTGVEVFAETVDGSGLATLQRRAFTDAAGNYALEALPAGGLWFLVAQPVGSLSAYPAAATSVNATAATSYAADLSFSTPQTPGSLTLTVTPASTATQGTWGELRQTLATGLGGSQVLIVRSQTVATGVAQDQAGFLGLAPGAYGVTAQRSTSGGAPVMKTSATQLLVSAGGTASTVLTYP